MRTPIRLALVAALAPVACSSPAKKHQMTMEEMTAADPLPLAKGAKWTYDVTVRRYDADTDKDVTKTLTWTTEVIDAKEANGITAYRVKGWPSDLAATDTAPVATERTLLRNGNNFLFGASAEPTVDNAEGWFSWPMMDGQKFCPKAKMVYCWQVTATDNGYWLKYFTGPDEESFEIEPNTGVTHYHYAHHGPTDEVEAKLVSFTKGS